MNSIKIIHALVFFTPVRIGGIEVYVKALAAQQLADGHDVKILVPNYPGEPPYESGIGGIPVLTYEEAKNKKRGEFAGNLPGKGLPAFIRHIETERPDIVHFHQLTSSNGISLHHIRAAKDRGIRVVFTNHLASLTCNTETMMEKGTIPCNGKVQMIKCLACTIKSQRTVSWIKSGRQGTQYGLSAMIQWYSGWKAIRNRMVKAKSLVNLCDKVILKAEWYHDVLKRNALANSKVTVIRQAMPAAAAAPANRHKTGSGTLKLVFVGRIFPDKGLHVLLQALQELNDPNVQLDVYGQVDGSEYFSYCKSLLSTDGQVRFLGLLANREVAPVLSGYDALVVPSVVAEMAPLIFQEALLAKIPVIGNKIGGLAEEISHGFNGMLVPPNDVPALANCLQLVIKNPGLLQTFSSNLHSPRSFSELAKKVEAEYQSVL